MNSINVEELKEIQLAMMDDIHQFCKDNCITYYLAFGTLLGAIRHKGYIPWDDDIDIMMLRPDYERFIEMYNQKQSPYRIVCHENTEDYDLPFGKVHDSRTVMNETLYKDNDNYGVYIDVFPLDASVNRPYQYAANYIRRIINLKKASFGTGRGLIKDILIALAQFCLLPFSVNMLLRSGDRICKMNSIHDTDKLAVIVCLDMARSNYRKSDFECVEKCTFEGREYNIPCGYDAILKAYYCDYMQLPPEEKRVSTHKFVAYWKD